MRVNHCSVAHCFQLSKGQWDVAVADHNLLGKGQEHNCQAVLLRMIVQHVAKSLNRASVWAHIYRVLGEFKLVGQWLQLLCLFHTKLGELTVK